MTRLFLSFLLLTSFGAAAQSGYDIKIHIDGMRDTTVYLAYYWSESTLAKDTARMDSHGDCSFVSAKPLEPGVYAVIVNKTRLFDIVAGTDQHFSLTTATGRFYEKMVVAGDTDNQLFFENLNRGYALQQEADPFMQKIKAAETAAEEKEKSRKALSTLREEFLSYQEELIKRYPSSVTARLVKASHPVEIPAAPIDKNGAVDSTFQLRWYRQHFFDNFDLSDPALVRAPGNLYQEKINEYLDKLYLQQPDSLLKAISFIVSKSQKHQDTYKYSVWICLLKYQMHDIMGLDEVYVSLYDQYFASGEMDFWITDKMKKVIRENADRMRRSLVGRVGKNLIMQDVNLEPRSMYDIKNKYTILFIFDPDCGHCRQETPKLVNFYNQKKFDIEVYAVTLDSSMVKMRNFIKTMNTTWITVNGPRSYVGAVTDLYDSQTTPTLYILDNRKKIIAKKIPIESIENFLIQHERQEKRTR